MARMWQTLYRSGFALVCLVVLAGTAATLPSWPQTADPGWDLLQHASATQDVPSTPVERTRSPLVADPRRVLYFVPPRDTDPRIDHFLKDHYVISYPTIPQNGKLFVFFPGTWSRPSAYQFVLDEAGRAGYKAIGLEYPNDTARVTASAIVQICARNPDPDCSAQVRAIRITGGSAYGVKVSAANGIQNRLEKLLAYLERHHSAEGWGQFLVAGHVNWTHVAVGGHSQGAGMAALLAKANAVVRVALWSGPGDYVLATHSVAPWLSRPSATPPDRWYAVVHRDEPGADRLLTSYAVLGVPGTPSVADASVPAGTHQFIVTRPPRAGPLLPAIAIHGSVAADATTPLGAGDQPLYRPVWQPMIGR